MNLLAFMDDAIGPLLGIILIVIFVLLILREVNCWYWKINQRVSLMIKTNVLLERISIQLGADKVTHLLIEDNQTGERRKITFDEWIDYKVKHPNSKKFTIIEDDMDKK